MKTLIFKLLLALTITSCNPENDSYERASSLLIEVDFNSGFVKDGGLFLNSANELEADICFKALRSENLPDGYSSTMLCLGSNGNISYNYIKIIGPSGSQIYLVTSREELILVHKVTFYNQKDCLKRWIKDSYLKIQ
ncbi:hypothetical protein [Chryseobacterium sp. SIMBA_028]|uniref:hypothetical protein n=1 Tax=Chryseobacterium sp. SIMBA_028 TaxID=3085771 RepID=UPI00397CD275